MQKTTIGEVLKALCEEVPVSEKHNRPITYNNFRDAMLAADLFSTRDSIKLRWQQLYNKITLLENRGTVKSTKQQFVVLDFTAVNRVFKNEGIIVMDYTEDEEPSESARTCRERETNEEGGSQ